MSRRLVASPQAVADAEGIAEWYQQQSNGVDSRFCATLDRVTKQITEYPESYHRVFDDVRRAVLRPFPYVLLHRVKPTAIEIVGILPTHGDPALILSRLANRSH